MNWNQDLKINNLNYQTDVSSQRMVFRTTWIERVIVGLMCVLWIGALVVTSWACIYLPFPPGKFVPTLLGVPFYGILAYLCLFPAGPISLHVDLVQRRYRLERGFFPLTRRYSGPLDDMLHLCIYSWVNGAGPANQITLVWAVQRQDTPLGRSQNYADAEKKALGYAGEMKLPFAGVISKRLGIRSTK